jgi:hypothetical protein
MRTNLFQVCALQLLFVSEILERARVDWKPQQESFAESLKRANKGLNPANAAYDEPKFFRGAVRAAYKRALEVEPNYENPFMSTLEGE